MQAAEYLSAVRNNGGNPYTLEELSDRTGLSSKTLTKVRRRQSPVDQPSLASYFAAFGLSLVADDYISHDSDSETSNVLLTGLLQAPLKGQLPLSSPFYIYRPPAENLFLREIFQPGSLVRIRAPRQFGKTSLVAQGVKQAEERGFRTAIVSLQLARYSIPCKGTTRLFGMWHLAPTVECLPLLEPKM